MDLPILYRDEQFIAINKPSGLLVHRSPIDKHESQFAVQLLRDQIGQVVFPIHRLDKPTSGVLLFALSREATKLMASQWQSVEKTYWAITRGKVKSTLINHPITTKADKGDHFSTPKVQAAKTLITTRSHCRLPVAFGQQAKDYPHTYFSLIKAQPFSGRKHQIRKHLKHLSHPIVGDSQYGKGEINRYFQQAYHIHRLLLHCQSIQFQHPMNQKPILIKADFDSSWQTALALFVDFD